jgi:hypothetical protein
VPRPDRCQDRRRVRGQGELGDGGVAIGHQPSGEQDRVVVGSTQLTPRRVLFPGKPFPSRVRWRVVSSDHRGLSPARASEFRRVKHTTASLLQDRRETNKAHFFFKKYSITHDYSLYADQ